MSGHVSGSPEVVAEEMLHRVEDGELLVVSPPVDLLKALVTSVSSSRDAKFRMKAIASEGVLRSVRRDFACAWEAADLVMEDSLTLSVADDLETSLAVTDDTVWTVGQIEDTVVTMATVDSNLASDIRSSIDSGFDLRDFDLRTPPRSRVRATLADEFSDAVRDDFETGVTALSEVESDLDAIHIAVLAFAKQEELLYELGKWGEDIRLASKATISRKKSELEDLDLIDTEKVPADIGRPRQRLKLCPELDDLDTAAVVEVAVKRYD